MADKSSKILLIDDDKDIQNLFKTIANDMNIDIICAGSVKESLIILKKMKFDAYIIDALLPDKNGIALAKFIREKIDNKNKIALISSAYKDMDSFKKLKETFNIDYILNKPIPQKKIKELYKNIISSQTNTILSDDEQILEDLKNEYNKTIVSKLENINNLIQNFLQTASEENKNSLKTELHKIAGSAGTYGFSEVSNLCKSMEIFLGENNIPNISKHILQKFFNDLKLAFQLPTNPNKDSNISKYSLFFDANEETQIVLLKILLSINNDSLYENIISKISNFFPLVINFKKDEFLIIEKSSFNTVKLKLEDLHISLKKINLINPDNFFFNYAIAKFPKDGKNLYELIQKAETNFSEIKNIPKSPTPEKKKTVLLVDDDKNLIEILTFAFKNRNFYVISANSGEEAINIIEQMDETTKPSIIILDREMPDMDGIKLKKYLSSSKLTDIPVIFLSSKSTSEDIIKGLKAGAKEYLTKPFSMEILMEKVYKLIK